MPQVPRCSSATGYAKPLNLEQCITYQGEGGASGQGGGHGRQQGDLLGDLLASGGGLAHHCSQRIENESDGGVAPRCHANESNGCIRGQRSSMCLAEPFSPRRAERAPERFTARGEHDDSLISLEPISWQERCGKAGKGQAASAKRTRLGRHARAARSEGLHFREVLFVQRRGQVEQDGAQAWALDREIWAFPDCTEQRCRRTVQCTPFLWGAVSITYTVHIQ